MERIGANFKHESTRIFFMGLMGLLLVCFSNTGFAQKEPVKTSSEMKEVQGRVSNFSREYITITYEEDREKGIENEIMLPVEDNIRVVHKKSLEEIKIGDIVNVQYEQITEEYEEGQKRKRKAKVIKFIRTPREDELRSMER